MSLAGSIARRLAWVRRSSTLRLSLLLAGIFAFGFVAAILVALTLGADALDRRVETTLRSLARATEPGDARRDDSSVLIRSPSDLGDLPEPFRRIARQGGGTVTLEDDFRRSEAWRILIAEDAGGAPVFVALPLDDSEDALELVAGVLWTTALAVIALALAVGLGAGFLAQRRLARIDRTLADLAGGELSARTGVSRSRDDLDDIARQLDRTAGELERLVAQTRHLSASLAHDLRTPLARLRARLEMLPEGEARGAALEEASRLSAVFDTIMRVARIEAAQGRDGFVPVDLAGIVDDLHEAYGPVVEDAGKTLCLDVTGASTVDADRQMLIQAMANLIQNALVHGGDRITLFARGRSIGVEDDGPGIAPEAYSEVVKPMVRLDPARSRDGSGLGLALVRAVADRHGADLRLSPADPQGLRVTLNLAEL